MLSYNGTPYNGFQRQREDDGPTVQGTVEAALSQLASTPVTCVAAGRTDTGVHATGQVIAFELAWNSNPAALTGALNHHLPPEIAVRAIRIVDAGFHPRYDAASRTYLYRIYIASERDPLREAFMWRWRNGLNVELMRAALRQLVGTHDFGTFGQPPQGISTVRTIFNAELAVYGDELHLTVCANAFLKRMMRSIVGTLVDVGREKISLREFEAAFAAKNREMSGPSAPPRGLVLTHVNYRTGW